MDSPGRGASRVVRGLTLAGACLLLTAGAHAAVGSGAPGPEPALLGAVLLSLVCVAAADRRRGVGSILAVVAVSQPVLHVLLALSHDPAVAAPAVVPGPGMVLAHAVAGAVVAIVLAGAEAALWGLAALSSTLLLRSARRLLAGLPRVAPVLAARPGPTPARRPYGVVVSGVAVRRGPPVAGHA